MNDEIKKIMSKNFILSPDEAEKSINFVLELIELDIENTKMNEPYATKSINEMQIAYNRVRDVLDMIY